MSDKWISHNYRKGESVKAMQLLNLIGMLFLVLTVSSHYDS